MNNPKDKEISDLIIENEQLEAEVARLAQRKEFWKDEATCYRDDVVALQAKLRAVEPQTHPNNEWVTLQRQRIAELEAEVSRLKEENEALRLGAADNRYWAQAAERDMKAAEAKLRAVERKIEDRPRHGFDRNSSHTEDRYVCDCGYDECYQADDAWADTLEAMLEEEIENDGPVYLPKITEDMREDWNCPLLLMDGEGWTQDAVDFAALLNQYRGPKELDPDCERLLLENLPDLYDRPDELARLKRFREAVVGWRENDHPEWFCRRTAEYIADLGRAKEGAL